jgi:hypothetical protein
MIYSIKKILQVLAAYPGHLQGITSVVSMYMIYGSLSQLNSRQYLLYRSFATTVSQLKICDFSGKTCKGFEVL